MGGVFSKKSVDGRISPNYRINNFTQRYKNLENKNIKDNTEDNIKDNVNYKKYNQTVKPYKSDKIKSLNSEY